MSRVGIFGEKGNLTNIIVVDGVTNDIKIFELLYQIICLIFYQDVIHVFNKYEKIGQNLKLKL